MRAKRKYYRKARHENDKQSRENKYSEKQPQAIKRSVNYREISAMERLTWQQQKRNKTTHFI